MCNLFHYTSVEGFEGIIKSNSIRMTKSDFLNDPDDCHLFVKLVEKYLETNQKEIDNIISELRYKNQVEKLYYEKGCDLIRYIKYVQRNTGLYILSLSKKEDEMSMWNYYGHGGMQLEFSTTDLVDLLRSTFVSEKEFLTEANVIYANKSLDVEKISVPDFSQFVLVNSDSKNIFEEHRKFLKGNSENNIDQLYSTSDLSVFIYIYYKAYVKSLNYLIQEGEIDVDTNAESVFSCVFENTSKLDGLYYWKHDLSLYMLVLSALIKSDTYKYEDEYRIVYFEHDINMPKQKTEEYNVKKSIDNSRFLYSYITFNDEKLIRKSLKSIVFSPTTSNLPINSDTYIKTIKNFVKNNVFADCIDVRYSKHTIRW